MQAKAYRSTDRLDATASDRVTFFRQSGWLMIVNLVTGVVMLGVHFLSKLIPEAEYGTAVTLLTLTMLIPAIPLQMVVAQQTAADLALDRRRVLAGKIRGLWGWLTLAWSAGATAVVVCEPFLSRKLTIGNPAAVWITLLLMLGCFWMPVVWGMLQGAQNFLWLGLSMLTNAVVRVGTATALVWLWRPEATSIVSGALLGVVASIVLGVWQSRAVWAGPAEPLAARALLRETMPLFLGFGVTLFLFSADTVFVKWWFPEQTAWYASAGTLARGLIWLVGPLAAVMFPKVVRSTVRSENGRLLGVTLVSTGVLAGLAGVGLCLVGPWLIQLVYTPAYVEPTMAILPWYAAAMIPLALANVLVNHLLASNDYRVVPWLVAVAGVYVLGLLRFHEGPIQILQVLGVACLLMFGICWWFVQRPRVSMKGRSGVLGKPADGRNGLDRRPAG
ncbi:MAG: hypothetical protein RMN51_07100 [Verrucomicrobiota bacterium]|nr:hypothetical protein [Limisphaera sp.]MDW8381859.1 hypothetical protein [Verrucomicrobiota bacterium]